MLVIHVGVKSDGMLVGLVNERELEELSEQFDKLSTKKFGPQNTSSGFGASLIAPF